MSPNPALMIDSKSPRIKRMAMREPKFFAAAMHIMRMPHTPTLKVIHFAAGRDCITQRDGKTAAMQPK